MWYFGMRHFATWWVMVVCVGLSSFGASSSVGGWTTAVAGRMASCFSPMEMNGSSTGKGCGYAF